MSGVDFLSLSYFLSSFSLSPFLIAIFTCVELRPSIIPSVPFYRRPPYLIVVNVAFLVSVASWESCLCVSSHFNFAKSSLLWSSFSFVVAASLLRARTHTLSLVSLRCSLLRALSILYSSGFRRAARCRAVSLYLLSQVVVVPHSISLIVSPRMLGGQGVSSRANWSHHSTVQ